MLFRLTTLLFYILGKEQVYEVAFLHLKCKYDQFKTDLPYSKKSCQQLASNSKHVASCGEVLLSLIIFIS